MKEEEKPKSAPISQNQKFKVGGKQKKNHLTFSEQLEKQQEFVDNIPDSQIPRMVSKIPMTPDSSSNIKAIGFDTSTDTLVVEYKSNQLFEYKDVPKHLYADMLRTDSVGIFISKNIKGKFKHKQIKS